MYYSHRTHAINFSFRLKIQFPRYCFTQALTAVILFVYKLYRPRASKVAAGVIRRLSSVLLEFYLSFVSGAAHASVCP